MKLVKLFLAAVLLSVLAGHALARPATEAENKALVQAVTDFDAAMRGNDYATVVKTIPPRVLEHMAKTSGMTVDALRGIVIEQMQAALATVKIESFAMDVSKVEYKELPNGEPYALIPTEVVMDAGGADKILAKSQTLALLDGGAWYLLRINEDQQVTVMRQVYPEFAEVEFPAGSMEALKKP
ncbi:MAG TPA: hypothetical protein VGV39_02500 [Mesorhizobium sp.]|jgi:hypothetical protein|uniref:hypothetical protein n=1 Tax=Mesorhizobium sp. TaxID=1871066 RepID=UPI002DDD674A|nr:hypothetical protein [Mesorhizobium sp.]HEV2501913.1 hypothetical protein [Mesorhizobium sp.]